MLMKGAYPAMEADAGPRTSVHSGASQRKLVQVREAG
jgi:hypothetical protein